MFTIKLLDGFRTRIFEAESFTILHQSDSQSNIQQTTNARRWFEITLHMKDPIADLRYDVGDSPMRDVVDGAVQCYRMAYIENAMGRTVERIGNLDPTG